MVALSFLVMRPWVIPAGVIASAQQRSHGFREDPDLEKWLQESGIADCNIPRISGTSGNLQALRESLELSQPVVVSWPYRASWTFDELLQSHKYINKSFYLRPVLGRSTIGNIDSPTTLKAYLNLMREASLSDNFTMFENNGLIFSNVGYFPMEVNATMNACSFLNEIIGRSGCRIYLSLGFSRLGLPFHRHKAFSYTVEQGRKMFALMPPGSLEKHEKTVRMELAVLPPSVALHRHLGIIAGSGVLRCILQPGDSLILPAYWNHMTLAIGDSLGFSDQFQYVGGATDGAQWMDWCEDIVPELVLCESQVDCVDKHVAFLNLTENDINAATEEAPMHQCVAAAVSLYWHPRDSRKAESVLRWSASWYIKMVSQGLDPLVAAEIIYTWSEIAEHFMGDEALAGTLAQTANSFFANGGYWRSASQEGGLAKKRKLYKHLKKQLRFTRAPACELRVKLMDRGLLPQKPVHRDL